MAPRQVTSSQRFFAIIEGGAQPPSPWQDFPKTVAGRSPFAKGEIAYFRLSKSSLARMDRVKRRQPIYDAWANVVGKVPPLNNSSSLHRHPGADALVPLFGAHACFRGVKRAVGNDKNGFDVIAYVTRPKWGLQYAPSMVCPLEWYRIPNDLVFVTYVRLDQPEEGRYGTARTRDIAVKGVVSQWEFVEADKSTSELPTGHQTRYRHRLW
jgi:hypothetical protein